MASLPCQCYFVVLAVHGVSIVHQESVVLFGNYFTNRFTFYHSLGRGSITSWDNIRIGYRNPIESSFGSNTPFLLLAGLGPRGSPHEDNLRRSYDWTELVAKVSHGTGLPRWLKQYTSWIHPKAFGLSCRILIGQYFGTAIHICKWVVAPHRCI